MENTLTRWPVHGPDGSIDIKKTRGRKSRRTVPLKDGSGRQTYQ